MTYKTLRYFVYLGVVLGIVTAYLAFSGVDVTAQKDNETRWYVYRDGQSGSNHGEWTNYMPKTGGEMIRLNLMDTANPASGDTCVQVAVNLKRPWWCGIAVTCKADYWGTSPWKAAYDLSGTTKLIFKARGQKGGETIQVKVAILGGKPYGDSTPIPAASSWIKLTKAWQTYELDLTGYNLKRLITPFCWVTNKAHNRGGEFVFYLDDIYFVMGERG